MDSARWNKMSISEQILNIGGEGGNLTTPDLILQYKIPSHSVTSP